MPKDKDKISGVKGSKTASAIEKASSVDKVKKTVKTTAVKRVSNSGLDSSNKLGKALTSEEREKIHNMIEQEAQKLFKDSNIQGKQKEVIQKAVKMAIDAAIIEEEEKKA